MREDDLKDFVAAEVPPRSSIDRRHFFKILGDGIIIFFSAGDPAKSQERRRSSGSRPESPAEFNAFLKIGEDGRLTCFTGKIEMGQGIITSLAQMLAEELDVPLRSVDMVMGDTDLCPWDMGTFGSRSTKYFGLPLREAAASAFRWSPAKVPGRRGHGVACGIYLGTYVAAMAEVAVDRISGKVRVKRLVCAEDMGQIINPEGARMQMEGSMMMGLGYALAEEIHFQGGAIRDLNFDTYEIPRFSWLPKIEAVLVENPETPPQGAGEPPITCMGAVIANAVFDATGVRLFELPMTPERIKKALAKS